MMAREAVRLEFPLRGWRLSSWQRPVWEATSDLARPNRIWMNCGRGAGKDIIAIRCVLRDALRLWGEKRRWNSEGNRAPRRHGGTEEDEPNGGGRRGRKGARKGARTGPPSPEASAGRGALVLNPLVKIWVIAPQENNLRQVWEDWEGELKALAREWGPAGGYDASESEWLYRHVVRERKYILFGRGEIEIEARLSSTRDALRGPGVDLVHWTEFAVETVPGELERAFVGELAGTITRAGRLGRVYATTTPKGPFGWFHDHLRAVYGEGVLEVENGRLWSESGLELYVTCDSFANEFLTREQLVAIESERVMGWFFEQERRARFVIGDKGGERAFSREDVEKCLVGTESTAKGARGAKGFRRVVFGLDIARFGEDWTVFVGVDQDSGEVVWIERHQKLDGRGVVDRMEALAREWRGCRFVVDDTGHRGYIADFAPGSLSIEATQFGRAKEKWVGGLRMLLQMGKLRIPDPERARGLEEGMRSALRALLAELLAYVKVIRQNGGVTYSHPRGMHDDCVDGLLLASMDLAVELQSGGHRAEEVVERIGRMMI